MADEDDLESYWSDVRVVRPAPIPEPHTRIPMGPPKIRARTLPARGSHRVQVGLFDENGVEVPNTDYARVETIMTVDTSYLRLADFQFRRAQSHWGPIASLGVFTKNPDIPALYLDMSKTRDLPMGRTVIINNIEVPLI